MNTQSLLSLTTLLVFAVGCEVPSADTPQGAPAPVAEAPETETSEKADTRIDMSGVAGEPLPTTAAPREFTAKDPKQGKLSRQAGGYLGAVTSTRFTAVNRTTIYLYQHAMNLYNAEKGHYPKTHEEFMEKIIKFNQIKLPELEEGDEYLYDPEDHTLKIYRPEP
ncbi:MAG: hypothetical protein MI725_00150 [Pirellulales bacterium]|nr:hypothetical protein [Pirellulales bacterium]